MVRARALLGLVVAGCPKATPSAEPEPSAVVAPPSPFAIELLPGEREPKVWWDRVRLPEAAPAEDILEPFFWGWHVIRNRCRAAASFVIAPASVRAATETHIVPEIIDDLGYSPMERGGTTRHGKERLSERSRGVAC